MTRRPWIPATHRDEHGYLRFGIWMPIWALSWLSGWLYAQLDHLPWEWWAVVPLIGALGLPWWLTQGWLTRRPPEDNT
jgi:hypothetical protein